MNKLLTALVMCGTLALGACASSPWDSMDYREAQAWQSIGADATAAQALRGNGFTPGDSKPWFQVGIKSPRTIFSWHQSNFNAMEAAKWMGKGISLNEAISYRKKGLVVE